MIDYSTMDIDNRHQPSFERKITRPSSWHITSKVEMRPRQLKTAAETG